MTEPVTPNISLIIPNTNDLPGAWGTAALNPNFQLIDAKAGGVTNIGLSSATSFTLTSPNGTATLSQQSNSLIVFTGALTGNALITFTVPGFYIVHNKCTGTNSNVIQLRPSSFTGGSFYCCAPPGRKAHIFYDGNGVEYVDMPEVGSALDLHGNAALGGVLPAWVSNSQPRPYLVKDGTVYTFSQYPALGAWLGNTYGGDGVTTFGVPDERARMRIAIDPGGATGRLTGGGGSGMTAALFNSAGGNENVQAHTHANTVQEPAGGHSHGLPYNSTNAGGPVAGGRAAVSGAGAPLDTTGAAFAGATITNASYGAGGSQNMPPSIVSHIALIKT